MKLERADGKPLDGPMAAGVLAAIALMVWCCTTTSAAWCQELPAGSDPQPFLEWLYEPTFTPSPVGRQLGLQGLPDWRQAIDTIWGDGLPTQDKLNIFDEFWRTVDWNFACFQGLDVDWKALRDRYRPEIAAGVSRGRFAAIMNHLALALRESHTRATDILVNVQSFARPGVPLMYVGGWGFDINFGACLTLLPDDSLLVYRTVPNHPLGLEPGDRILGYDGRRWRELYQEVLRAELPLNGWWGASPVSFDHAFMMAAGRNWHLFDVMDIVRHSEGETVHVPTAVLDVPFSRRIFCSEQLDVPGVPSPGWDMSDLVRWGVIENTQIGYIYVYGWIADAGSEFLEAVRGLTIDRQTSGLIIDFRMNVGGNMFLSNAGLNLLFRDRTLTISFAMRRDPTDHLFMEQIEELYARYYIINDRPDGFSYDRPIAVLTGPGAVSSGDQVALRMTFHPKARTFGKTTATAFNGPKSIDLPGEWFAQYAVADAYRLTEPSNFLTHDEFAVDTPVWLTEDDVAKGKDTVVETAVRWIQNRPPTAAILVEREVECQGPKGAIVRLDGSASVDPDSIVGANDGIAVFEWVENPGTPNEALLGRGEILSVPLQLGDHRVALRVTDEFGEKDTVEAEIRVVDTTPPRLEIEANPGHLWPPDHRLVNVRVVLAARDACGSATVELTSIASDEPDESSGAGGGEFPFDIQGAAVGEPDFEFRLRAERQAAGDGRVYTVRYAATDAAGNRITVSVPVVVPHDARDVQ